MAVTLAVHFLRERYVCTSTVHSTGLSNKHSESSHSLPLLATDSPRVRTKECMQFQLPQHCDGVVTAARLLSTARVLVTAQLLAAVEVVPLAASAAPVVVRGLRVGKVVGILGLHVVEASGLVEVRGLCVEGGL